MVKSIVILLGYGNSGKSRTLKKIKTKLTKIRGDGRKYSLNGRNVFIFTNSPQEELHKFRNCPRIIELLTDFIIKGHIDYCNINESEYILLLPFTIFKLNTHLNDEWILKPIQKIKSLGYKVHVVYLKGGKKVPNILDVDDLANRINKEKTIISRIREEDRQANELKNFLINLS
jgi:hypothetical protein